ncbi:hypothetical protein [Streptomyces sp. NPDC026673]|uniref:hypothetical protein n=1 Tax=Streptomyces sp. NPDC026673 TaxID=3155724 RepID=UPI00340F5AA5
MRDLLQEGPRRGLFGQISSLPVWQALLAILPFALLFGGAIGSALGAVGAVTNLKLARTSLAPVLKALCMVGVALGSAVVYLAFAVVLELVL